MTMQKSMKFLIFLFGIIPSIALSAGFFNITPNVTSINMGKQGKAVLDFTVVNMTNKTLVDMTIDPSAGITNPTTKKMITINNNCSSPLGSGASCTFQVIINSNNNLSGNIQISPTVCAYHQAICAQPTVNNRVQVSVIPEINIATGEDYSDVDQIFPPMIAFSNDNGKSWSKVDPASTGYSTAGYFSAASCIGTFCVAVGGSTSGPQPPLLVIRPNTDQWAAVDLNINSGFLYSTSCTSSFCIAAGNNAVAPLLLVGKTSWSQVDLSSLVTGGVFYGTACTNSLCIAVGQINQSSQPPLIVVRNSSGNWEKANLSSFTNSGTFNSASCLGSVCVAVGQDLVGSEPPLMGVSTNSGGTWNNINLSAITTNGSLRSVSCSGQACIAVGSDDVSGSPLMIISEDNGATWNKVNIAGLTTNGVFTSVSCSVTTCIAVGGDYNNNMPPLMVASNNQGNTWRIIDLTTLTSRGILNSVACSGSFCMASGQINNDNPPQPPLLLTSDDNGVTWKQPNLSAVSTDGIFYGSTVSFSMNKSFGIKEILKKTFKH